MRAGRATKQARRASIVKSTKPPNLEFVYAAIFAGKIEEEEAINLNPRFQPNKQYGNLRKGKYLLTQGMTYKDHHRGVAPLVASCVDIHSAVEGGHITKEEGKELNKRYKPENKMWAKEYRTKAKARYIKESGIGKTPSLVNLHRAYLQGLITEEEAIALNSDYDLSNKNRLRNLNSNLKLRDSGYFTAWEAKTKGVIKNDR